MEMISLPYPPTIGTVVIRLDLFKTAAEKWFTFTHYTALQGLLKNIFTKTFIYDVSSHFKPFAMKSTFCSCKFDIYFCHLLKQ